MADKINVPIVTSYDDKEAKEAIQDAELIDKLSPEIEITADSTGIDTAKTKMEGLTEAAGGLPGPIGEAMGLLGAAGPAAAVAGIATGAAAIANSYADTVLSAEQLANLTGATIEKSSRIQALWQQTGADANDLADSILNMNGVLADSPEIARRFGVNLQDGRDGVSRMVELVEKVNAGTGTASDKARILGQLFGEEGVRQVNALTTLVGTDLQAAMDGVADTQVFSDEDVREAREFKQMVAEIKGAVQQATIAVGRGLVPALNDARTLAGDINSLIEAIPGTITEGLGGALLQSNVFTVYGQIKDVVGLFGGETDKTNTLLDQQVRKLAAITTAAIEHGQVLQAQQPMREAANRQAEDYLNFLTQRGDEAAQQKKVNDETKRHYDALARVNTEAERVDRARILARESDAVDTLADDYKKLHEEIGEEQSWLNLQEGLANATEQFKEGNLTMREARQLILDQKNEALLYIETLGNVPAEKTTEILALIDQGKFDEADRKLAELTKQRKVLITVDAILTRNAQNLRRGGIIVDAEAVNQSVNGTAVAAPAAPMIVNVNMPRGSRGVDVMRQVSGQARRSGRRYGTPVIHFARRADAIA